MSQNIPQHNTPADYAQFTAIVTNGTVGSDVGGVVIRTPTAQRAAMGVYSTEQANSLFLPYSGGTLTGPLSMDGYAITQVLPPINATDAATKGYVDAQTAPLTSAAAMTSNLNMGGNSIINLPPPASAADAATKLYVDTTTVSVTGDTMTGALNMGGNAIHALPLIPASTTDAACKNYVDSTTVSIDGDTMTGTLKMGYNSITQLPPPVAASDAATRGYVDSAALPISGGTMTSVLNMGNNAITNVADPQNDSDAANMRYVYTTRLATTGGNMTGAINMGTHAIVNVHDPTNPGDAATKNYADNTFVKLSGSAMTGALNMGGNAIGNVATPQLPTDAVNKSYADLLVAGVSFMPAVACYTVLNGVTFTYDSLQTITMTLTPSGGGTVVIDGYTVAKNTDRILINTAANQAANGVYNYTTYAAVGSSGVYTFTRAADLTGTPIWEFEQGGLFYVTNGTIYGGSLFVQSSAAPSALGTSPISYSQYAAAKNIAAGANVVISGNQLAVAPALTGITSVAGLAAPVNSADATNKSYVDAQDLATLDAAKSFTANGYMPLSGGTATNATLGGISTTLNSTLTCAPAGRITGVPTPSGASDAVPKSYADLLVAGLTFKPAVACYTTLAAPFASFVYNGGQQITISLAATPIDGYTLQLNDRVLVNCATPAANGVYVVTQLASPITLVRPVDLDGTPLNEFQQGGLFYVVSGNVFGGSLFVQTSASPAVLGTSPILYSQYAAAKNISAGANIAITGNSVAVAPVLTNVTSITGLDTPAADTAAARKLYVDTKDADTLVAAKAFTSTGYMPLSGGTLTNSALAGTSSTITGTLTCSGAGKITGVPTPSSASDAVPKSYADLLVAGLTFKPAVACYTTLTAPFASFVYNGGQQITISLAATPIDGYTLQLNDRVLVNCAGTQAANGVYLVTQLASPITLVRPADLDGSPLSEFQQGGLFYVTNGTVFGGSLFVQSSASPSIIGTSAIVYSQYSAAKNIAAGTNIAITGNSVAVAPALSGITGVGLSASDGSAGVLTVSKASGADSYALALPSAAPASNTFLKYDGANYSWSAAGSPLTGGTNINITSNAVGLNAAVSGLTSVGINGTSSSDALTLTKATGGAAYTLALPAAAPAANTYLNYTGSSYVWGAASGGSGSSSALVPFTGATSGSAGTAGGVPAPPAGQQNYYLQANGTWSPVMGTGAVATHYYIVSGADQTTTGYPYAIQYTATNIPVIASGGISHPTPTTFVLPAGATYKCTASIAEIYTASDVNARYLRFYNNTTATSVGHSGMFMAPTQPGNFSSTGVAVAYITATIATTISVLFYTTGDSTNSTTIFGSVAGGFSVGAWVTIETVSDNNTITAFTGATATTDGIVGYIPAPPAGTQNSYLRGDGTWQQANNSPTAAQYLFARNATVQTSNGSTTVPTYLSFPTADTLTVGSAVSQTNTTTFTLQVGYTYKISSAIPNALTTNTNGTSIQIYVGGVVQGVIGTMVPTSNGFSYVGDLMAICYVTPTVISTVQIVYFGGSVATIYASWATIEVVSNNNTITPFIGASNSTNGLLGYIPAPLSGQQNAYLRGDGTWQQANNAPTATQYLHMIYYAANMTDIPTTTYPAFPFNSVLANSGGGFITPTGTPTTTFILAAGGTYKCTASMGYSPGPGDFAYQWLNNTTNIKFGTPGDILNSASRGLLAIGYITTTATTTISLNVNNNGATINTALYGQYPWCTIEVVSNNNAITAFTGATSVKDGTLGYLPAPKIGDQNSYLCGNGTWQSATVGPFAAQYLFAYVAGGTQTTSGSFTTPTYLLFPSNNTLKVGDAATQSLTDTSKFTILPGYSYKITSVISQAYSGNAENAWMQIYVNDVGQGVQGKGTPASNTDRHITDSTSVAYITPIVSSTVQVGYGANSATAIYSAWITIEVVANNNNITAFSGATATNDGIVGYIPAPKAGNQNMFLRGDGSWQNATIAHYYYASLTSNPAANTNMVFNTNTVSTNTIITTTNGSSFTLATGYTYKISVCVGYDIYPAYPNAQTVVTLYNNGVAFGTPGNGYIATASFSPIIACGYVTTTVPANITIRANHACIFQPGFITIEVVSGNNAITGFVGATATTDGIVGYIPPPKAGSQNMFLRGDGSWQNATAAQYVYASNDVEVIITSNNNATIANWYYPFNKVNNVGSVITVGGTTTTTTFTLGAGCTFKCTFELGYAAGQACYGWYNITNLQKVGSWAGLNTGDTQHNTAIAYITTTTTPVTVGVAFSYGNGIGTPALYSVYGPVVSWATIELVSGNNAITAFKGATTNTDGGVGYIPAPPAGTQNSYLRGDGTWQQANNAPTAAQYYLTTQPWNQGPYGAGSVFPFLTTPTMNTGGGAITQVSTTQFLLAAGYSYKLSASLNSTYNKETIFQWFDITASPAVPLGISGDVSSAQNQNPVAFAYVKATSAAVLVHLQIVYGSSITVAGYDGGRIPWALIEVVSNNNTITAFTGATSTTNGVVGYIPAPPAGTQNSYLRGDGTWQQANNAPTAAQYLFATSIANQTVGTVPVAISFPDILLSSGVTALSNTTFTLLPFSTYKLSGCIQFVTANMNYRWFNVTAGTYLGEGVTNGGGTGGVPNMAFITTTVQTTVALYATWGSGSLIYGHGFDTNFRGPWITIEMLSNNNTITQFTGCTAYQNGSIGYIPAPALGDQTKFLCANGTWSPSVTAGTDVSVAGSTVSLSATLNSVTTLNNVAKLTGLSAPVSGPDAANKTYVDTQDALKLSLTGGTMSGALSMGGNKVSVTYTPTATTDVPNKFYVDTQVGTKVSLSGGTMSGALNMGGQTISNAASMAINGTSSSDALTVSKATGGAAYTLALPAAAPASNTYLKYDGTNYAWSSAGSALTTFAGATSSVAGTLGGVPAPQAGQQNSYLRGDGTWSVVSGGSVVAAEYLLARNATSQNTSGNNDVPTYLSFPTANTLKAGSAIAQTNASTFTLKAGYTYKITSAIPAGLTQNTDGISTQVFVGGVAQGSPGRFVPIYNGNAYICDLMAICYVTPTVDSTAQMGYFGNTIATIYNVWISIEVVSNNNTITAFTGATATTNGIVGYIPAPPAGTQNSYLRGDGTWQQANNAPTAAQYLQVTNTGNVIVPAPGQPYPYANTVISTGSYITQPVATTSFLLLAGATYKCTATMGAYSGGGVGFNWYNATTSTYFGSSGIINWGYANGSGSAIGYITTVADTTIRLLITGNTNIGTITIYGQNTNGYGSIATIEVVSNNNTITAFTGATSTANGAIGYIPAPQAGQQNHVLTGAGSWAPYRSTLGPFTVSGSSLLISGIPPSKKITITYDLLGITNTNNVPIIQLGTSSGIIDSTYNSNQNYIGPTAGSSNQTNGFWIGPASAATEARTGQMILTNVNNTIWVSTGQCAGPNNYTHFNNGRVALSGVLDRIQITSNGGTFNTTNSINVLCEM